MGWIDLYLVSDLVEVKKANNAPVGWMPPPVVHLEHGTRGGTRGCTQPSVSTHACKQRSVACVPSQTMLCSPRLGRPSRCCTPRHCTSLSPLSEPASRTCRRHGRGLPAGAGAPIGAAVRLRIPLRVPANAACCVRVRRHAHRTRTLMLVVATIVIMVNKAATPMAASSPTPMGDAPIDTRGGHSYSACPGRLSRRLADTQPGRHTAKSALQPGAASQRQLRTLAGAPVALGAAPRSLRPGH